MSTEAFNSDNPFPGLRAFASGEADRFFGRQQQVGELAQRLTRSQFIAVSGNSGCGKSSLVKAGLLHDLSTRSASPDALSWRTAIMLPGDQPISNLSIALSAGLNSSDEKMGVGPLYGAFKLGGLGLCAAVRQARLAPNTRVLLVVDQFEELFRLKQADPNEASAFVKLLLNAALDPESPISVIITLRSNSLGYCADFNGLPEAINQGLYMVPKLTRDQRKDAIVGPVELRSRQISPRLVQRILNDVSDDFDDLPIMQHALSRTWSFWVAQCQGARPIDLEDYQAIGTTTDAISKHANQAAEEMPRQEVVERVFRALTVRGPQGEGMRRPLPFDRLCDIVAGERHAVENVVKRFSRPDTAFLRINPDAPLTASSIVDISHESLIRQWHRLSKWIHAEAESLEILKRLVDSARRRKSQGGSLWRGRELKEALKWQKVEAPTENWAELYLQELGVEAWQSAKYFLQASRRRSWCRKVGLAVAALFALLLPLALSWLNQSHSGKLTTKAIMSLDQDPTRSAHLARAAIDRDSKNELAGATLRQSLSYLEIAHTVKIIEPCETTSMSNAGKQRCDPVRDIRYSPDGSQLLVAAGKTVTMFDPKDFQQKGTRIAKNANVLQAWLINSNRSLVTKTEDMKIQIQQLDDTVERSLACPDDKPVWAIAPSPDDRHLAIGCHDGEVLVWDVTQMDKKPIQHKRDGKEPVSVTALDFSADGTYLASGDAGGKIQVWKLGEAGVWADRTGPGGKKRLPLEHSAEAIRSVHFFKDDSNILVTAGDNNQAIVWKLNLERAILTKEARQKTSHWPLQHERAVIDAKFFPAQNGEQHHVYTLSGKNAQRWMNETNDPKQIREHDDWVRDVSASQDGKLLVTACADGTGRIWSTRSGPPIAVLRGHRGSVNRAIFSPIGDAVFTASDDGTVRVWNFRAPEVLASLNDWALGAAFDSNGARVAITHETVTPCILELSNQNTCPDSNVTRTDFDNNAFSHPSWSNDGKYLVGNMMKNKLDQAAKPVLWEIAKNKNFESIALKQGFTAVFRSGADELLTLNLDGRLSLWDAKNLEDPNLRPLLEFGSAGGGGYLPAISPDGQWIALINGKEIDLWHRSENTKEPTKLVGHDGPVKSFRFSNDSSRLLSASEDRTARIWSISKIPTTFVELHGGHAGAVYSASFDPTGEWVVTSGADGIIIFWNAKTGLRHVSLRWHSEGVNSVEFSPNGQSILSASDDGTVKLGKCESCTLSLNALKARVPNLAILSTEDTKELEREIER